MARTRVRDPSFAPLRVCPCTPLLRDMVLAVRDVRGPWPDHVQRDTTSDGMLALGHSRSGTIHALVAQQGECRGSMPACGGMDGTNARRVSSRAEQPPCKRQAALSNRRRGHHQPCRVRLDGRGHHSFKVGTRVRIPHAMPVNRNPVKLKRFGVKIGRNDRAAPEPVTGWTFPRGCCSTPGRAAALQAAGCRFGLTGLAGQDVAQQRAECRARSASKPVTSTNATSLR
jgi:hypothetical protein